MCTGVLPDRDGVAIEEVLVPAVVEAGAEEAVLDCPFTFSQEEEDQLEVRWFFNSSPTPFYQWSPGMGDLGPQVKRRGAQRRRDLLP